MAVGYSSDRIGLWNPNTGVLERVIQTQQNLQSAVFSRDGIALVTSDWDYDKVGVWDPASGEMRFQIDLADFHDSVWPLPFWGYLALTFEDGSIQLWDLSFDNPRHVPQREPANALAFSPDGETLTTGGFDGTVRIWDIESLKERHRFQARSEVINQMTFSPDGRLLAIDYADNEPIEVWEVGQNNEYSKLRQVPGAIYYYFSPDSKMLVIDHFDGDISLYNIVEDRFQVLKDSGSLYDICLLAPNGKWIATHRESDYSGLSRAVTSLCEKLGITLRRTLVIEGHILVRNVATGRVVAHFRGMESYAFSPGGELLAIGRGNGEVQLWQVPDVE